MSQPRQETSETSLKKLCETLISEGQQVETLLGSVADKASADVAAERLDQLLASMSHQLRQLQSRPITGDDDVRTIKTHMTSLTHISQMYLTTMKRLYEVEAYGSEKLMEVFRRYGVSVSVNSGVLQADDLPHTELYNKLSDQLENVLFVLRKTKDDATAAEAMQILQEQATQMERTRHMLTLLDPPRTDEQREAVLPSRERLMHLRKELLTLRSELQASGNSTMAQLMNLLERILVASAG